MKLDPAIQHDGQKHEQCVYCHAETVEHIGDDAAKEPFYCRTCHRRAPRELIIDPAINWWIAPDGEYWHESAGIFVRDPAGKFLFFERVLFPRALTVPAGHVDNGETAAAAAHRELHEEVGVTPEKVIPVATEDITGDSCRRGSDAHRWHAYLVVLSKPITVTVCEEGENPVWLSLDDALQKNLTHPVRWLIERYKSVLQAPAP